MLFQISVNIGIRAAQGRAHTGSCTSQALARLSKYWEDTILVRGSFRWHCIHLAPAWTERGAVGFLGLGDKILDALVCPVPSCTVTERCLVYKHRMGVKECHFLHGLEHLISPYFLICTTGTVLFIERTGGCKVKLINVKDPLILLDKRFSRSMKNSYLLSTFLSLFIYVLSILLQFFL